MLFAACESALTEPLKSGDRQVLPDYETLSCTLDTEPPELVMLLDLHNQSRNDGARCGVKRKPTVPSLQWNCELTLAARKHADDMHVNDFLGHQGSGGSSIGDRATAAGYVWREISENVAQGYQDHALVFEGWISSRAHCSNIMSRRYQQFGAAKTGNSWVVMLGRERDF